MDTLSPFGGGPEQVGQRYNRRFLLPDKRGPEKVPSSSFDLGQRHQGR